MEKVKVKVKKLHPNAKLPRCMTKGSAGYDLFARSAGRIYPGHQGFVPTGIALEIEEGCEGQIRPRSGLAMAGVTLPNSPATIDSDFRGEVVLLVKAEKLFSWEAGARVAQIVFCRVPSVELEEVDTLNETERGNSGFGSTGI